jgi:zona occludens toxin (predicted ATPase)
MRIFVSKIFLFLILYSLFLIPVSYAQTATPAVNASSETGATLGVAHMVDVKDKNVKDGIVLSAGSKGAVPTTIPYDSQILGIVARDAAIIINTTKITVMQFNIKFFMLISSNNFRVY